MRTDSFQPRILIVDDAPENIEVLGMVLSGYQCVVALTGKKALDKACQVPLPDLILLDIVMPGPDGYEVCRQLKADPLTRDIPVIFITAKGEIEDETRGLELGAVDYITKPFSPPIVLARVKTHLMLKKAKDNLLNQNAFLEDKVLERTQELVYTQEITIQALASLAETRDNETGGHIRRSQGYVRVLAERLHQHTKFRAALNAQTIDLLYKCAPLHDIGKVGVPDAILLKPGKLEVEELREMKNHVIYGRDALLMAEQGLPSTLFLRFAREIVYSHHEKWNGGGYPEGICGDAIPLSARLMAVADVYDALISKRVYKAPMPHTRAREIILGERGQHFDPDIVDAFAASEEDFIRVGMRFADYDEERAALLE